MTFISRAPFPRLKGPRLSVIEQEQAFHTSQFSDNRARVENQISMQRNSQAYKNSSALSPITRKPFPSRAGEPSQWAAHPDFPHNIARFKKLRDRSECHVMCR